MSWTRYITGITLASVAIENGRAASLVIDDGTCDPVIEVARSSDFLAVDFTDAYLRFYVEPLVAFEQQEMLLVVEIECGLAHMCTPVPTVAFQLTRTST